MEDTVSRSSVESSSTGEDFVMVNGDPKLKITGDINDINEEITDDSSIDFKMASTPVSPDMSDSCTSNQPDHVIPSSQSVDVLNTHKVSNMNSSMDESKSGIPGEYLIRISLIFSPSFLASKFLYNILYEILLKIGCILELFILI